jgi:hypothetical protein
MCVMLCIPRNEIYVNTLGQSQTRAPVFMYRVVTISTMYSPLNDIVFTYGRLEMLCIALFHLSPLPI